jgi:hypothetical protein
MYVFWIFNMRYLFTFVFRILSHSSSTFISLYSYSCLPRGGGTLRLIHSFLWEGILWFRKLIVVCQLKAGKVEPEKSLLLGYSTVNMRRSDLRKICCYAAARDSYARNNRGNVGSDVLCRICEEATSGEPKSTISQEGVSEWVRVTPSSVTSQ